MKQSLLTLTLGMVLLIACKGNAGKCNQDLINDNVKFATQQIGRQVEIIEDSDKILNPRTIKCDKIQYVPIEDWTSGFFPGTMWYMYELTGDEKWKNLGIKYTEDLDSVKYLTWHHDVGFMINTSFGNAYRLTQNEAYKNVMVEAAKSLATRYRPTPGVIQSWDENRGWQGTRGWMCPVIIDNMMNLELFFKATHFTGDSSFYKMAVSHADVTLENHFRKDFSCYHVIDYDKIKGGVRHKQTAQGYADESAWARGQAWAIYGFAVCYRETKDPRYLDLTDKIYNFLFTHKNMPEDLVPYWDFDAPHIPNEPRDVSAAAVIASALYELSTLGRPEYKVTADKIVASLSSPAYRAILGTNGNFLLMHSVGSIPHGHEIDVPLNYADYYFLEALLRKQAIEK
ncbi:MAG: glycoside hydrolase family 88 protein [Paludibacter sp.]|nr:glycoside hydrolase family 88 protein [Paludibacter sp.]MDD4428290.1 glycoside hydrolase family 88 protein [Paludibacter sp.]